MPDVELENVDPKQNQALQPETKQAIVDGKARGVSWVDHAHGKSLFTVLG